MAKMHKLTKGGQTIFPATIYDAVVNPKTRKSLTTELTKLEEKVLGFDVKKYEFKNNCGFIKEGDKLIEKNNPLQCCIILDVKGNETLVTNAVSAYEFYSAFTDDNGTIIETLFKSNVAYAPKTYTSPHNSSKLYLTVTSSIQNLEDLILYGPALGVSIDENFDKVNDFINSQNEINTEQQEINLKKADLDVDVIQSENLLDISQGYIEGLPDGTRPQYDITLNHYIPVESGVKYYYWSFFPSSYNGSKPSSVLFYNEEKEYVEKKNGSDFIQEGEQKNYYITFSKKGYIRLVLSIGSKDSLNNIAFTTVNIKGVNERIPYHIEERKYLSSDINIDNQLIRSGIRDFEQNVKKSIRRYSYPIYDHLHASERFFSLRSSYVDCKLVDCENIIWVDSNNGLDINDGKTYASPIKTLSKLSQLITNNSIVRIRRGSVFRDDFTVFSNLNTVRFESYGKDTEKLPIITSLSVLTEWEKVSGYNTIYRCSIHAFSGIKDRAMTQVYVDGKRIDDVSLHYNLSEEDAMKYLSENPDHSSWFSGGKYSEGWEEQDCFYYVSLSDTPSNHLIEANRYFDNMLLKYDNRNISFVGIEFRGSGHRDGLSIAVRNMGIFFDNCIISDNQHHGVVFNEAYFHDTTIRSELAKGIQYHFYFSSDDYNFDIIISNCKCLLGSNNGGTMVGGHGATEGRFGRLFIEDFYAEGGTHFAGAAPLPEGTYADKVVLKGIRAILDGNDYTRTIFINRLRAHVNIGDSKPGGYYSLFGEVCPQLYLTNSFISYDCSKLNRSYLYNGDSKKPFGVINCKNVFFYLKNYANLNNTVNKLIKNEDGINKDNCQFVDCIIAAEKPQSGIKELSLVSSDIITLTGTKIYGMKRFTFEENIEAPLEDLKKNEFMRLMYIEESAINSFVFE